MNTIDTGKVTARRKLRFETIDDVMQEIDRIDQAAQNGTLKTMGNWTAGQILSHVAAWVEYGYTGYPMNKPPFFVRWILRMRVKKMLSDGMSSGVKIPGVPGGTYGADDMPVTAACARAREAFGRLRNGEVCGHDSPAFGPMSHDDRIRLNLRHAELHFSFLDY